MSRVHGPDYQAQQIFWTQSWKIWLIVLLFSLVYLSAFRVAHSPMRLPSWSSITGSVGGSPSVLPKRELRRHPTSWPEDSGTEIPVIRCCGSTRWER